MSEERRPTDTAADGAYRGITTTTDRIENLETQVCWLEEQLTLAIQRLDLAGIGMPVDPPTHLLADGHAAEDKR